MTGVVVGANRDLLTIELDNGAVVSERISGRLFINKIRVLTGDKVQVENDALFDKGRITYRFNRL